MIRSFTFKEVNIRFKEEGKGRAIILVHGFLENLEVWNKFSKDLSKQYRVISLDLPGHGRSENIAYVHTMEEMAECVRELMKTLRLRKVFMVGHSMGGYVALAFAELFPDNLKGLCLFHSTALADTPEKRKDRDRAIETVKKNHKKFARQLASKLFADENLKRLKKEIAKFKDIASSTSKRGIIAGLEGMKIRKNREVVLKFAPYPVLIIAGKKDAVIPHESLLQQAKLPEQSELILLEKSGHMGFMEEPKKSFTGLKTFISKAFSGLKISKK